jgi:hypothetical protein
MVIKTNQLMMYKAKVAVCSEIRTTHLTQSEHNVECLMLNLMVSKETARLEKAKQSHLATDEMNQFKSP